MGLPPLSPVHAVAWTIALSAALILLLSFAGAIDVSARQSLAVGGAVEVLTYGAASYWLVREAGRTRIRAALGLVSAPVPLLLTCCLLGVVLHGPADFLEWLVRSVFPVPEAELRARAARLMPESLRERVALALVAALFAPLVEELFFRGALWARLSVGWSRGLVVGVTAVCFTISHPEPRLWPALGLVGVVLGILRGLNRGLYPCFLLHAAFNATTLAVAFADPGQLESRGTPSPLPALVGALLSASLVWLAARLVRTTGGSPA